MAAKIRTPPMPGVGDLMRLYQLQARKHMAQNFLLDLNICRKIVRTAGHIESGHVLEIGPGPGGITRAIYEQKPKSLTLIEKDNRFARSLELLNDAYPSTSTSMQQGDILRYDMNQLWASEISGPQTHFWDEPSPNFHIIANLPFNVATPLIIRLLKMISERSGPFRLGRVPMTLTFQKEVGQRMVASIQDASKSNTRRCRLSPICQYLTDVQLKFVIPRTAFVPEPQVDCAVMHFVPKEEPLILASFDIVERFFRHIFHFRQKKSIRGVETLFPEELKKELSHEIFRRARVNPATTCIMLEIEELRDMVYVYEEQCHRHPGLYLYNYRSPKRLRPFLTLDKLAEDNPDHFPPPYKFKTPETQLDQSLAGTMA